MHHPDVDTTPGATERMAQINRSYEILKDAAKRAAYDGTRGGSSSNTGNTSPPGGGNTGNTGNSSGTPPPKDSGGSTDSEASFWKKYGWWVAAATAVLVVIILANLPDDGSTSNSAPSVSSTYSAAPTATPRPPRATATPVTSAPRESTSGLPLTLDSHETVAEVGRAGGWRYAEAWYRFDMEATFHNPHGINTTKWDYGFRFHSNGKSEDFVILDSNGWWYHRLYDGTSWNSIDRGTFAASLLDTHAYGSNKLRLTVNGTSGKFYVNGTKIADIRVSSSPRGSGLGFTTCTFGDTCIKPVTVKVTDFMASPL
jgi:curved DNA-binding protein CbpA